MGEPQRTRGRVAGGPEEERFHRLSKHLRREEGRDCVANSEGT